MPEDVKKKTGNRRAQRQRRRQRESGLPKNEVSLLRLANARLNGASVTFITELELQVIATMNAIRGARRTQIQRSHVIKLSEAQNHRCCYCGQKTWHTNIIDGGDVPHYDWNQATIEHVIAQNDGGTWCKDNLVMACKQCNCARGSDDLSKFIRCITSTVKPSKKEKRAAAKKRKDALEKAPMKQAKLFRLLVIAAMLNPEEFEAAIGETKSAKNVLRADRSTYNPFRVIRKRVIANNMVFA